MAKKSISDFLDFSLFIFDLDNTIYNEEDYLFQAYSAICERFASVKPGNDRESLSRLMIKIYADEGREKLFDKFLIRSGIGVGHLPECLKILRGFNPEKQIELSPETERILRLLIEKNKLIFVLTNGNPGQQRNKISKLMWDGLDEKITFIMANEIEPKPSAAGIEYILKMSGIQKEKTIFIGDSLIDHECASRGEIEFINIADLKR